METAACAVGRLGVGGAWLGFVPSLDDGYLLVVVDGAGTHRVPATADDLLSLAFAYFAEALDAPPDELAATHADIAALVRHVGSSEPDGPRSAQLAEAIDAIDDGLGGDAVAAAVVRCLAPGTEPLARLRRRASEVVAARR